MLLQLTAPVAVTELQETLFKLERFELPSKCINVLGAILVSVVYHLKPPVPAYA